MRIKIDNQTDWRSDDIRALVKCAARVVYAKNDKTVIVRYRRANGVLGRGVIGSRGSEARTIWIYLPSRESHRKLISDKVALLLSRLVRALALVSGEDPKSPTDGHSYQSTWSAEFTWLARDHFPISPLESEDHRNQVFGTIKHELMHNLGVHHRDMTPEQMHPRGTPPEDLPLRLRPLPASRSKEEKTASLVETRAARARELLTQWQRRAKAASNKVKKHSARVRYYETKLAAQRASQ